MSAFPRRALPPVVIRASSRFGRAGLVWAVSVADSKPPTPSEGVCCGVWPRTILPHPSLAAMSAVTLQLADPGACNKNLRNWAITFIARHYKIIPNQHYPNWGRNRFMSNPQAGDLVREHHGEVRDTDAHKRLVKRRTEWLITPMSSIAIRTRRRSKFRQCERHCTPQYCQSRFSAGRYVP
jgi:hypothetical protein